MAEALPGGRAPRSPRAPVTFNVQHQDESGGRVAADRGENISATGLFVRCAEPYTVGTKVRLVIALPDSAPLIARGRVVRVGAGTSGHTGMGIMFTILDDRVRAQVERLVTRS